MTPKKLIICVAMFGAAVLSAAPVAAQDKSSGSGPNPFTDCGIGAALFSETKWAAVTSNVIWDLGITALVSATASPQTCSGERVTAALFIRDTYDHLAEETAAGHGEHLNVALSMFGCAVGDQAAAAQQVRRAMARTVSTPGYGDRAPLDKAADFFSIVDRAASTSCVA